MSSAAAQKLSLEDNADSPESRVIAERYQVLRTLKSGHDTETLLATDRTQGATVVVKTARAALFSATARMRLEHEAQVLTLIKSGPTPLLDHGTAGDHVYLVMP